MSENRNRWSSVFGASIWWHRRWCARHTKNTNASLAPYRPIIHPNPKSKMQSQARVRETKTFRRTLCAKNSLHRLRLSYLHSKHTKLENRFAALSVPGPNIDDVDSTTDRSHALTASMFDLCVVGVWFRIADVFFVGWCDFFGCIHVATNGGDNKPNIHPEFVGSVVLVSRFVCYIRWWWWWNTRVYVKRLSPVRRRRRWWTSNYTLRWCRSQQKQQQKLSHICVNVTW